MHRRRLLAGLGTGLAVGLAGCGDAGTDDGGSEDDSGSDGSGGDGSDDDEPESPFPDADWRDGDGIDVETLAERHTTALVDSGGFTLFSTAESTHDGEEEPSNWLPSQEYESRYDLDNERQYLRQALTGGDRREISEAYVEGTEAFFREQVGDQVSYDSQTVDRTADDLETAMRREAATGIRVPRESSESDEVTYEGLNLWNLTDDGAGEVADETTARFAADTFDGDRNVPETVESASATAHVYERGVVPRIDQSWEGTHDGQGASVDVTIDYRNVGESLTEPDWVEDAREETS